MWVLVFFFLSMTKARITGVQFEVKAVTLICGSLSILASPVIFKDTNL